MKGSESMSKVAVVGGGAAGMMAAISAAGCGHEVTLYEKNEKLGKKVFITGKGRCNLTNACGIDELFSNIVRNPKFTYSAVYTMDNEATMAFFEEHGLRLKKERGNRVFPASDHSSDVIAACRRGLEQAGVEICLNTRIIGLETVPVTYENEIKTDGNTTKGKKIKGPVKQITGVTVQRKGGKAETVFYDAVILASGGLSYPVTGSDGDGFAFAKSVGHTVTGLSPALVPLNAREDYVKALQGLSLRNVSVQVKDGKKICYEGFGEMLFTHFGVSGPLMLSASSILNDRIKAGPVKMTIDLKPALTMEQLEHRLLRDFEENKNRQFKNALSGLFPAKLIPVMIQLSGIHPEKQVNSVSREERGHFAALIKAFPLTVTGLRGFEEAIITRGGVSVKEVDASTMESKRVKGLYFCGEMLDVDALTGGFNLQIAWSTGNLAGLSVQ